MITIDNITNDSGNAAKCTITYPENIVYLKDANFVTLSFVFNNNLYNFVQYINCQLQFVTNHGNYTYRASVYDRTISFNINDMFAEAFAATTAGNPNEEMSGVYVYSLNLIIDIIGRNNGSSSWNQARGTSISFSIYDGYSLPNRAHGTDTAAFVPPQAVFGEEEGTPYIHNLATDNVISDGQAVSAGNLIRYTAPEDDCIKEHSVQVVSIPKNWRLADDTIDWTYGIKCIVIDRVWGFTKALVDDLEGSYDGWDEDFPPFQVSIGDQPYTPITMILVPTQDIGVWEIGFVQHINDKDKGEILTTSVRVRDENGDRVRYFVKEGRNMNGAPNMGFSLFSMDWSRPSVFSRPILKIYKNPTEYIENDKLLYDIDETTPIYSIAGVQVSYDTFSTDYPEQYKSFQESPLTAIRFYASPASLVAMLYDRYFEQLIVPEYYEHDYHYVFAHPEWKDTRLEYAKYWMFGNHIIKTDPTVPSFFLNDRSAFALYMTLHPVGIGLCQLLVPFQEYGYWDEGTDQGWYSYEWIENQYGVSRMPLKFNSLWYNLWSFYNTDIFGTQGLVQKWEWSYNTNDWHLKGSDSGNRKAQALWDVKMEFMPTDIWHSFGNPMIEFYHVDIDITFPNATSVTIYNQDVMFYPTYNAAWHVQDPTFTSSYIPIVDKDGNYYKIDGTPALISDQIGYIQLNFNWYGESQFQTFDFIGNGSSMTFDSDYIHDAFTGIQLSAITINSFTINEYPSQETTTHGTFGKFYYMPFTCNVPFVKMGGEPLNSEKCAQLSLVNIICELPNKEYPFDHQVLQLEEYYDTWCNLGETVGLGGSSYTEVPDYSRNISHPYIGNDKNLTFNYNEWGINSRFTTINEMYNSFEWNPSLHIEDFNVYGDRSFVIKNGCNAVSNQEHGDIASGDLTSFNVYTFGMCNTTNPVIWIRYKNMDGLWRWLPAKICEQIYTNQKQDLQFIKPQQHPYNAFPLWKPYSLEEKITIYLSDIPASMHIEDILYSPTITLYSHDGTYREIPASLEEDSITRNLEGGENFVLHFIKKQ